MDKLPHYEQNLEKLAKRTMERATELERVEQEAIANFKGQLDELSGALGMLRLGDHFGWRVLVIIHSKKTIRKYEKILDIQVREFFPEEGPSASRSMGYQFTKKLSNFWKAVSGEIKVERRREIDGGSEKGT